MLGRGMRELDGERRVEGSDDPPPPPPPPPYCTAGRMGVTTKLPPGFRLHGRTTGDPHWDRVHARQLQSVDHHRGTSKVSYLPAAGNKS